ncbi:hypothetical protein H0H81_007046 [Sphagnurus paluster]|uniref:Putative 5'-nucleotidase C-terminal domain-containing protein n=1 Tax=Sphagnurus paluster TaxID=117069 RepID=A0A9P7GLA8_9AGAR|nr:hypothetical protein H0H81_007046 [Sphagnurus paluster]
MPVKGGGWNLVFNAIRKVHPFIPITILGGHTHVRDCKQLDRRSISLESGRYMETVGWISVKLDDNKSAKKIDFTRRYLDPNRVTYEYHTNTDQKSFDTLIGAGITHGLLGLAKTFNLGFLYGTAPRDYTLSQDPYPSAGSALTLFVADAVPYALAQNNPRAKIPNFIIANSGSQRFDVYSGSFTKNDLLTTSPYEDTFLYIPDITLSQAKDVLANLNKPGLKLATQESTQEYANGDIDMVYNSWLGQMSQIGAPLAADTIGYVTHDSCPGDGDDTPHKPLPYFPYPNFVSSRPPTVPATTKIDLVFNESIERQLLTSLNAIQKAKVYTSSDAKKYSTVLLNQAIGIYAKAKW